MSFELERTKSNVHYKSPGIATYYSHHRTQWSQFYPSEKQVLEYIQPDGSWNVLDMGCACGGLALALKERFGISSYIGVDINPEAIATAKTQVPWGQFIAGDFLDHHHKVPQVQLAFSLSCADWNVQTEDLYRSLFSHVREGGWLVTSVRATDNSHKECIVTKQRVEFPNTENDPTVEYAPYKVYPWHQVFKLLSQSIGPVSEVYAYGYWGAPAPSVENLGLDRIFYVVFALRKGVTGQPQRLNLLVDPNLL